MSEVKMKKWNMRPKTRIIVSEAYKLCKEMNERYNQRVTVRQIYYYLFSKGIIQLDSKGYHTLCYVMTEARKRGYIPFNWIEDRSRDPLWIMLYDNLKHFFNLMIDRYKRNTWKNQENFVIILVEKEALASIVWDIAKNYNVFVFPTKGFSSWSMFVGDIKTLVDYFGKNKKLVVLVFSDLDPSGQLIGQDYVNKFEYMVRELGFQKPEIIERVAVTPEQVEQFNLPPRKKTYKRKGTLDIWELDALNPKILRDIVKNAIERYLDLEQLSKDLQYEKEEKSNLVALIEEGRETRGSIGEDG
jgi:hypothetical protein